MKPDTLRIAFLLPLLLLFSLVIPACAPLPGRGEKEDAMTVTVFRIGKADAVLITLAGDVPHTVLIDTGEADDAAELTAALRAAGTKTIDCLILTHFDKDHIGGAPGLLSAVGADRILYPDRPGEGESYDALMRLLSDEKYRAAAEPLASDTAFSVGEAQFTVSVPQKAAYDKNQDNNFSLAVTVVHAGHTLLFAGDAERERQEELISAGLPSPVDFLKVPHHGVWNKGLDDFFSACAPVYAAVTCSDKNPAEDKTLDALSACGTKVFLTSSGNVTAVSTPGSFTVTQNG